MTLVQKSIYYRQSEITNCESTLQELLEEALKKTRSDDRKQVLNEGEDTFCLINVFKRYRGFLTVCQMVMIDPGASQPVAIYNPQQDCYLVDSVSTDELDKDRFKNNSDFINAMLYFGVSGNEVVVMPSLAINIRLLESHLSWLLGDKMGLISGDSILSLNKLIPRSIEEEIRDNSVKSIEIGSLVSCPNALKDEFIEQDSISIGQLSMSILRKILAQTGQDKLLDGITEESRIKAKLRISYDRKTDDVGQKVLDQLGANFRHMDDADVSLTLRNNMKISGDSLNLKKTIKVEKTERGLYFNESIYSAMSEWLIELSKNQETS